MGMLVGRSFPLWAPDSHNVHVCTYVSVQELYRCPASRSVSGLAELQQLHAQLYMRSQTLSVLDLFGSKHQD